MLKINSFSKAQQKTRRIYLDIAAFQDFNVSLLLPQVREDCVVYLDRKVKNNNNNNIINKNNNNNNNCKFELKFA